MAQLPSHLPLARLGEWALGGLFGGVAGAPAAEALLRAGNTTAAVLAGGCGGVFVPFLAIGDLGGRVFAKAFGVPADLAGAAGAAAGIAGGYRLPFTAVAMVLGVGGPGSAKLTCLATVGVAAISGVLTARAVNSFSTHLRAAVHRMRSPRL